MPYRTIPWQVDGTRGVAGSYEVRPSYHPAALICVLGHPLVAEPTASRLCRTWWLTIVLHANAALGPENVGSQFLSLRRPVHSKHSPLTCETAKFLINRAFVRNLRHCEWVCGDAEFSLANILSKRNDS